MSRRVVLVLTFVAAPAVAQRLPARIAAAPDGTVRMSFPARPAVCGNGRDIIAFDCSGGKCGRHTIMFDGRFEGDEVEYDCEPGPVRVSLTVRKGAVQSLRTYVGGRWAIPVGPGITDLGMV
ncbi:MAG: hypothetical protein DMD67_08815 [Gemmatimonadetes bacterium]|nr:MAG: hypothetical protein DMD67_08815 [Gemmatimonadota bacterium]